MMQKVRGHINSTRNLSHNEKKQLTELWNRLYPAALAHNDVAGFEGYLSDQRDVRHLLLLDEQHEIKGWLSHFIRDKERWFSILVDPSCQGHGWGSRLLSLAKKECERLNGWIVDGNDARRKDGKAYLPPVDFYLKNGFVIDRESKTEKNGVRFVKIIWEK